MKVQNKLRVSLLLFSFTMFLLQVKAWAIAPIETRVPVTGIYVPKGFDDNDRSEIFIEGYLPNLCFRSPSSKVKVVGKTIRVEVTSLFGEDLNTYCLQMIIPFQLSVPVGVREKGIYQIKVNGVSWDNGKTLLPVQSSISKTIDENVYLAVNEVKVSEGNGKATLKGYNPSDCFELDRVQFISNGINTYSVLPIMKQTKDFCPMKMMPFEVETKIPRELNAKRILLHVRSMNGNAINTILNLKL